MTLSPQVAAASDTERAIATLVLAFAADPAARWTWPEPARFLAAFPEFARAFGGRAFEHSTAFESGDYAGVALWLPPGVEQDEDALMAAVQRSMREEQQADGVAVMEQMGRHHPSEPHWYLPAIGVDPARQGQGHGSALLAHALALCDADHLPAYLESSNRANLPLYERHGFVVQGTIQVGSSPTFWPMLRAAR